MRNGTIDVLIVGGGPVGLFTACEPGTSATVSSKQLACPLTDNQRGGTRRGRRHSTSKCPQTPAHTSLNATSDLTLPIPAPSPLEQMSREELDGRIRGMG